MTEREALLAAVLANPKDDVVRLVYADWLEENGEPAHAMFIRAEIEIAKTGHRWCGVCNLCRTKRNLSWSNYGQEYQNPYTRRGFIDEMYCAVSTWMTFGPIIVKEHPVRFVWLYDKWPKKEDDLYRFQRVELDELEKESFYIPQCLVFPSNNLVWEARVGAMTALSRALIDWAKGNVFND
jgi:uncharacterized protein (TIGR02996 family)